jgi:hypothetical protein
MDRFDFHAFCRELLDKYDMEWKARERIKDALKATPPPKLPKNCWLDDEPYLFPSPCVFDDPDEVINNCTYARTVKCKTDCKYYRVAAHPEPVQAPPPEPPTVMEIIELSTEIYDAGLGTVDFARAVLERWGHG